MIELNVDFKSLPVKIRIGSQHAIVVNQVYPGDIIISPDDSIRPERQRHLKVTQFGENVCNVIDKRFATSIVISVDPLYRTKEEMENLKVL